MPNLHNRAQLLPCHPPCALPAARRCIARCIAPSPVWQSGGLKRAAAVTAVWGSGSPFRFVGSGEPWRAPQLTPALTKRAATCLPSGAMNRCLLHSRHISPLHHVSLQIQTPRMAVCFPSAVFPWLGPQPRHSCPAAARGCRLRTTAHAVPCCALLCLLCRMRTSWTPGSPLASSPSPVRHMSVHHTGASFGDAAGCFCGLASRRLSCPCPTPLRPHVPASPAL